MMNDKPVGENLPPEISLRDEDPSETKTQWLSDSSLDHVLQALVDLTNRSDLEFSITLNVSGFLVSGTLVSGKKFFEGLAKEMASAFPGEAKDSIHDYFTSFGNIYNDMESETSRALPVFIHLSETRMFHPSGKPIPGNRGILWRGRISHVSGFSMGRLSAE